MRQIGAKRQVNRQKSEKNSSLQLRLPMELISAVGAGCCLLLFLSDVTASEISAESISCTESLNSTIELPDRLKGITMINDTLIDFKSNDGERFWFPLSMKTNDVLLFKLLIDDHVVEKGKETCTWKFSYNKCDVKLTCVFSEGKPWDLEFYFGGLRVPGYKYVDISIAETVELNCFNCTAVRSTVDEPSKSITGPIPCPLNGDSMLPCGNGRSLVIISLQNEDANKNCSLTMRFDRSKFNIMREIPPTPTTSIKALTTTAESGLSTAGLSLIIAGSALGLILLAICIVVLVVCLRKRRQRDRNYHGKINVESVVADNKMQSSDDLAAKTEPAVTTQTAANETPSVRVKKVFAKSADRNSSGAKKNSRKEKPSKSHTTESFEKQVAETMEVHLQTKVSKNNASQDTAETKTHEV
ncbi:hypothetical protein DdX_04643 [Ditylenchus destructor]|uniref:Uncharacterized protein n=1 Tax=Ditylenchus destructor TaxID=166010 RepID=A0AAD4R4Q5_9BILA|nr:hypothetical protein DdX_04643 [Ditylenchus destructor]